MNADQLEPAILINLLTKGWSVIDGIVRPPLYDGTHPDDDPADYEKLRAEYDKQKANFLLKNRG